MITANIDKSHHYQKLKKILRYKYFINYWCLAKNFDIKNHIEAIECQNRSKLYEFMSLHVSQIKLPSNQPNWRLFTIEKFENDRSAVIFKIDHSYGDGLSILSFFLNIGSAENVKFIALPKINRLWFILLYPFGIIKALFWFINLLIIYNKDKNGFKENKVSGRKRTFGSKGLDLAICKNFAKINGVSMNDVCLTLLSKSFQNCYMKSFGRPLKDFHIFIPTSMRATASKLQVIPLENLSNFVIMDKIPKDDDFILSAKKIHLETKKLLKNSFDFYFRGLTSKVLYASVPKSISWLILKEITSRFTCCFSNVPGPLERIQLFQMHVQEMFFFIGGLGDAGIVTNLLSYDGKVYFGCQADEIVKINVEELVHEFENLYYKELIGSI